MAVTPGKLSSFLQGLGFRVTNPVQAGIVSYNQWADLNVELPCSKMERWESSLLGHTVSADIPKFYSCDFSYKLPLPNEHIPYLRIKDAAKALAAV